MPRPFAGAVKTRHAEVRIGPDSGSGPESRGERAHGPVPRAPAGVADLNYRSANTYDYASEVISFREFGPIV